MGTTAEKGAYLNTTKSLLKDKINNLGGEITDETTFREYANQLQNVYDNLPKTEYQEGTEINLGVTIKGKLEYDNGVVGIGQTSQIIDLTENNLTSQSANGLTITVNTDKSITINGTASSMTVINLLNNTASNYGTEATARTLQVGTYSLTGCPSGSNEGSKFKVDVVRSGYAILVDTGNGNIVNITSSQTYTFFRIVIYNAVVCNNLVFRPKLLKIPSPSYPQTINSVTGNQDVVVSGSNIIGLDTNQYKVDLKAGDKITFKNEGTQALTLNLYTNYGDTTRNDFWSIGVNATRIITVAHDTKAIAWEVAPNGLAWGNYGDTLSSYEPYITPTSYQLSLGEYKFYGIGTYRDYILRTTGKNKFDEDVEQGSVNGYEGRTYENCKYNVNTRLRTKNLISLDKNKTYTISCDSNYRIMIQAFNDSQLLYITTGSNAWASSITFTNIPYISITIKKVSEADITPQEVSNARVMLEIGSTASDYQPFGVGNWYKVGKIGEIELDETLNWEGGEVATGIYRYQITVADAIDIAQRQNVLTEYTHFTLTGEVGTGFIYSKIFYFYPNTDCTNALLFKAWIANHHTPLLYPLATPTYTPITGTLAEQLEEWWNGQSLDGTTIIEGNGDLPMLINVRALKGA